jgi:hypothetical protein
MGFQSSVDIIPPGTLSSSSDMDVFMQEQACQVDLYHVMHLFNFSSAPVDIMPDIMLYF